MFGWIFFVWGGLFLLLDLLNSSYFIIILFVLQFSVYTPYH